MGAAQLAVLSSWEAIGLQVVLGHAHVPMCAASASALPQLPHPLPAVAAAGKWEDGKKLSSCDPGANKLVSEKDGKQEVDENKEVVFTYDVVYKPSDIRWASRWDTYLLATDDQIHWWARGRCFRKGAPGAGRLVGRWRCWWQARGSGLSRGGSGGGRLWTEQSCKQEALCRSNVVRAAGHSGGLPGLRRRCVQYQPSARGATPPASPPAPCPAHHPAAGSPSSTA